MAQTQSLEKSLFLAAIEIDSAAERAAYLEKTCAGNHSLRAEVEALLRANEKPPRLLDNLPAGTATIDPPLSAERPGALIGPYKLLQQIGEGGMGTVFLAEQTHPVQRKVAVKVIKAGMDSRQVIARFEAERQALAMMDHVNIARVLDAGMTGSEPDAQARAAGTLACAAGSGRPYFVMELVHGVPITKYCDDNHLTPRERLELFVPVCQAIQHAHQKGIIHRDIKPSNVMVTLYDGKPVPKVIDFGVAKATEQRLTERTLFTQYGTMIGTFEYMSPEQAEMSALGVDTRSDIFSLGVLLYELLTGSTPLTHKRLKEAVFAEVLRLIKEEEPPKPSTRLSDSGEALATISAQRQMEPAKLTKLMRGELDWIVMKCLEKDRNRRYETASAFAADVQCYLKDEPVQACPPSTWYRLRKFALRNKGPVAAGVALAALLALGIVGTSIGLAWALREERAAIAAATAEAQQRQDAETQRDRAKIAEALATERLLAVTKEKERATAAEANAKEEAAVAKAVTDFLQNDLLAEAAPAKNPRNKKVTVEEVLGRAAARIAGKFDQQPRIEAAIRQTIGDTYRELGNYPAAQPHLERALEVWRRVLGEEHPDTINSMNNLAALYWDQGHYPKAEPLWVKVLEVGRRVRGEGHPDTINSMNNLAALYRDQGQYAKADPLFVKVLEVRRRVQGEEQPETLQSMNNLAMLYRDQGQYSKAEPLLVKTLEVGRRILGEEHPDTLQFMSNLADLHRTQGQYPKAEPLAVKSLEVRRRVLGEEHPDTLISMNNLAMLYRAQGQYAKAEPLLVKTLEVRGRVLGEEHPETLTSKDNLALLYQDQGQYSKAEPLTVEALEVRRRVLGEEHSETLTSMNNLAALYLENWQFDKAEPLFVKGLEVSRRVLGEEHPDTLVAMINLAMLHRAQAQFAKAEPLMVKTLDVSRRVPGEEHPDTLQFMNNLALLYQDQRQFAKAELLFRESLEKTRQRQGEGSTPVAGALAQLGLNLLQQKKPAEAEPLLRECLAIRALKEPDDWRTFNTKSLLGGSLLDQKKYADAEPLLVHGYEGLRQRESKIPPNSKVRLTEALERLVQLYDAWEKKAMADEWRKKLEAHREAGKQSEKPKEK
jgi:eukaryotic-like serine/threonine-protein kinase